jgi:thiol peroxidase
MENERQETQRSFLVAGELKRLTGNALKVGEKAPNFTVLTQDFKPKAFYSTAGKIRIISVIPSIDTGVCDTQTRRFNQESSDLGNDVIIWTISVDLPYAQRRWCAAAGIERIELLSDYRDLNFALQYGVLVEDLRLLSRAVFVVDKEDIIRYVQYVPQIGEQPDYESALQAVKELL